MTVDLVVKSYPPDYPWLAYLLKSIQKFCTGFNDIIVMLPRSHPLPLTAEKVILLDHPENYLSQQLAKLNADHHTQADFLVTVDSDMIFTRPVTPEFFFKNRKPTWIHTPFGDEEKRAWMHVMVKCLQECPPAEFMRRCAVIVPRTLYAKFREFIQFKHRMTLEQYIMRQPGHEFSEWNCLGFFAWLYHREEFAWHDTATDGIPSWPFKQWWSYGGLKPEIRAEMEAILDAPVAPLHDTHDITTLGRRGLVGGWLNAAGLTGEGVEIGVMVGENAENILTQWNGTLHLVDPWEKQPESQYKDGTNNIDFSAALDETRRRMANFPTRAPIHRMFSDEAFEMFQLQGKQFDFVYLDGNHSDPQVTRDIEQWWLLMKPGGLFGGHDYGFADRPDWRCDVKPAVDRFVAKHGLTLHITQDGPDGAPSWWIIKP